MNLYRRLAGIALLFVCGAAHSSPGELDRTFGTRGYASPQLGPFSFGRGVVRLPDDRLLEIGGSAITRFLPDGARDTTFGSEGSASPVLDLDLDPDTGTSIADAVPVSGGQLLVLAYRLRSSDDGWPPIYLDSLLARLLPNGALDATFGTSGVMTVGDSAHQLTETLGGRFLLAGLEGGTAVITRIDADGLPDPTFGNNGRFVLAACDYASRLRAQPDGRMVVACSPNFSGAAKIFRLLADGSPDPSFGSGGLVELPAATSVYDIAIAADGTIAIGCVGRGTEVTPGSFLQKPCLARLLPDGTPDSAFGTAGVVASEQMDFPAFLLIDAQGRLLVRYSSRNGGYGSVVRLKPDGSPDPAWRSFEAPIGYGNFVAQSSGRIVAVANWHTGTASETALMRFAAGGIARIADFDADGREDIPWQHDDGRVAIWMRTGASVEMGTPGWGWHVEHIADIDGDGFADIVWRHDDGRATIYLMQGTAVKASSQFLDAGSGWRVVQLADLDGDGRADLVFQHDDGRVAAWIMNGTTIATGATLLGPGTGWSVQRVADFDGDSRDDILWKRDDGSHAIWLMDGLSVKASTQILGPGPWTAVRTGDLDGDGRADILWIGPGGALAAWLMNGTTLREGTTLTPDDAAWSFALAADVDGDGNSDLIFMRADGGGFATWMMNGLTRTSTEISSLSESGWSLRRAQYVEANTPMFVLLEHADGRAVAVRPGGFGPVPFSLVGSATGWRLIPSP